MPDPADSFTELVKRYPWALIQIALCVVIVLVMLLVFEDLPSSWHDFIASLTVYTVGLGFLAQLRLELTVYHNTKAKATGGEPQGISGRCLAIIFVLNILWLAALVAYNIWRGIIGFT
jgi:hypothetical protein